MPTGIAARCSISVEGVSRVLWVAHSGQHEIINVTVTTAATARLRPASQLRSCSFPPKRGYKTTPPHPSSATVTAGRRTQTVIPLGAVRSDVMMARHPGKGRVGEQALHAVLVSALPDCQRHRRR